MILETVINMFKKRKLESYTGELVEDVRYFAENKEKGKKAFGCFSLFCNSGAKRAIIKVVAFEKMADGIMELIAGDKLTVSVSASDLKPGEFILDSFVQSKDGGKVVRKVQLFSNEDIKEKNKELEKEGKALVPIMYDKKKEYILKNISETILVGDERLCQMEYIMDILGPDYVNKVLKEKLGGSIKFTQEFKFLSKAVKSDLLKQALTHGVIQ